MSASQPGNPAVSGQTVLVVDDDDDLRQLVRYTLEDAGFEVATSASAEAAEAWIERHGLPHLALVDIMMPGTDGLTFCRRLLAGCDLPVILLTAVDEEATRVKAIEELAEDYVTKPFSPAELAARVKRVARRLADVPHGRRLVVDENLEVDLGRRLAFVAGQEVALTPTECKILHILVRNAPRTVPTDHLLARVWPLEEVFEDTLRVHIHRLRGKVEVNPSRPAYLLTERGVGYRWSTPLGRH